MPRCVVILGLVALVFLALGCGYAGSSFEQPTADAEALDSSAHAVDTGVTEPEGDSATTETSSLPVDSGSSSDATLPDTTAVDAFDAEPPDSGPVDSSAGVDTAPQTFTLGGTLTGLGSNSSVVLVNAGGAPLNVAANGSFVFPTPLTTGTAYAVTVSMQPAGETCVVTGGIGTVSDADVSVTVTCMPARLTVGGTLSGLASGDSVVLQDNGGDNLTLGNDGPFTFATGLPPGSSYAVTVLTQPGQPTQTCVVTSGTGTLLASVTTVQVMCTTIVYSIGGTLSGLPPGDTIVLQDNGGDDLSLGADGAFTFATELPIGQAYAVTVLTQPAGVAKNCTVTAGTGVVGGGDVQGVLVNCTANAYTVGGTVMGLTGGDTLLLRNNGGDSIFISSNGSFSFPTPLLSGAMYAATVTNPAVPVAETCTIAMGSGVVGTAAVTNIGVACSPTPFTVGGTLSGLGAGDTVVRQDNSGDNLPLTTNGPFVFATSVLSGAAYSVSVSTNPGNPIAQTCTVMAGAGTVGASAVTSVQVTCASPSLTVTFPSAGSTTPAGPLGTVFSNGQRFFITGQSCTESFAFPQPISTLTLAFTMQDYTDTYCSVGTLSWNVTVNGTLVGTYSWLGGTNIPGAFDIQTVMQSYSFAPVAPVGGMMSISLVATTTVCGGGNSWQWIPGGSATMQ